MYIIYIRDKAGQTGSVKWVREWIFGFADTFDTYLTKQILYILSAQTFEKGLVVLDDFFGQG